MWVVLMLLLLSLPNLIRGEENFPTCGDCWCVPGNNGIDSCPFSEKPQTEFSNETVAAYLGQVALNAYTLNCNPYKSSTCETSPAQVFLDVETAVCGFVYPSTPEESPCSSYYLQTFPTREDASAAGAFVTHEGSCGLCSTTIDLAVYLSKLIRLVASSHSTYLCYSSRFHLSW